MGSRRLALLALMASIGFGIIGQLMMKAAALEGAGRGIAALVSIKTILALGVYALGVINWIVALRNVNLGVAYSLSSLNYVGIFLGSNFFFGEVITAQKLIGVALIFFGVMLIVIRSKTASERT
jgi:multidrug transporter EmrE-like cation transporter